MSNSNIPLIRLNAVTFAYGTRNIHEQLSLDVPRGSIVAIMGPSGCGKSTLLNYIGGRIKPHEGEVWFGDQRIDQISQKKLYQLRLRMGMLFQHNALLTDLPVYDNVAFVLRENTDLSESVIRDLVLLKLHMVGLRGARDLMPDQCSGGMRRRVALARAIAMEPDLVMYDEPFTGLDPIAKGVIKTLIKKINDSLGLTSIVVTHDMKEGCEIADFIAILGNGKVLEFGPADEVATSTDEDVEQFMQGRPDGPVPFHYPADDLRSEIIGH